MGRRRKRVDLYYEQMMIQHGDRIFCPVCDFRPCMKGCRLGFTREDHLVKLSNLLKPFDKKKTK